ncbi:cytochrome P450 [Daldinia caldariorum]|uniref:cytochrome P450 n=1 Tax=Daldinia caldariorum TaxID=326644 RepID=UPI002008D2C1|nr:cytochrome P450 [Daldinia caldariorum]KAI1464312.1 cytochrome P450 [Daldinia caldariorum]
MADTSAVTATAASYLLSQLPLFVLLCPSVLICFLLCRAAYNCSLHPLANFPGPRLWAASRLPYALRLWQGRLHEHIKRLHDQYGPVVRIAPDELSFTDNAAWQDIYCGGVANKGFPKHGAYRNAQTFESLFDASDDNHTRLRRLLKNDFFSLRAARRQERIVQEYAGRLIAQLRNHHCSDSSDSSDDTKKHPADLREWYNFATFDIIGRVTLSEDFGCLDGRAYHPWILMVVTHFKLSALLMCLRFYPPLPSLLSRLAPARLLCLRDQFISLIREKVGRRVQRTLPPGEEDFVTASHLSELEANSILLLLAGSETIATSLLSATHLLCENPTIMRRLAAEIRSTVSESDITYENTTSNMPYLNAVLRETHRLCPPLANGPARVVDGNGAVIAGHFVPPGTSVGVTQYAANRSSTNFTDPDEFLPERWLSPELAAKYTTGFGQKTCKYAKCGTDVREVVRPFSAGGRDCLGQNLAWVEFRVLLARMIWNFDFEVYCGDGDRSDNGTASRPSAFRKWTDQKAMMLWHKESYPVRLFGRKKGESYKH